MIILTNKKHGYSRRFINILFIKYINSNCYLIKSNIIEASMRGIFSKK
jgi:hypothetical protein